MNIAKIIPLSRKNLFSALIFAAFTAPVCTPLASADTLDFGGSPERFSGNGDRKPPRCQINVPRAAQEPFFIKWNCTDDQAEPDNIRTTLWILRNGAEIPEKVKDFLGFPASVYVDAGLLGVEEFTTGLPAAFRLVAMDRAGTSALSPYLTVLSQDNSVASCGLELLTDPIQSEGSTTGVPSRQVLLSNVDVQTTQVGNNDVVITMLENGTASPCEIDEICGEDAAVRFQASITLSETSGTTSAEGRVTVTPGVLSVNVEGSANVAESSLSSLEVTGDTTIDGVATRVTLSCSR